MRLPRTRLADAALHCSILFPALIAAVGNLDCGNIVTDGKQWDLSKLGGPRSVMTSHETPPTIHNTTYTIDICRPLKRSGEVKNGYECPVGTRGSPSLFWISPGLDKLLDFCSLQEIIC